MHDPPSHERIHLPYATRTNACDSNRASTPLSDRTRRLTNKAQDVVRRGRGPECDRVFRVTRQAAQAPRRGIQDEQRQLFDRDGEHAAAVRGGRRRKSGVERSGQVATGHRLPLRRVRFPVRASRAREEPRAVRVVVARYGQGALEDGVRFVAGRSRQEIAWRPALLAVH